MHQQQVQAELFGKQCSSFIFVFFQRVLACLDGADSLPEAEKEACSTANGDQAIARVSVDDFPKYARVFWDKEDLLREGIPVSKDLALSYMAGEAKYRLSGMKVPHFKAYVSGVRLSGGHYVRKIEYAEDNQQYGFYRAFVRPEMGAGTGRKPSAYCVVLVLCRSPLVKIMDASCQCVAG